MVPHLVWLCQGCLQTSAFAKMAARRRKTPPAPPGPSCKPQKCRCWGGHTSPQDGEANHRSSRGYSPQRLAAAHLANPPGGHLRRSRGPLAPFPWSLQVTRGINAASPLAAASRVLGGNCFHTTFTGESLRRSRKPQQGFTRWDSPFPPPQSASTSSYRWGRGWLWQGNASDLLPLVSVRIKSPPPGVQPWR